MPDDGSANDFQIFLCKFSENHNRTNTQTPGYISARKWKMKFFKFFFKKGKEGEQENENESEKRKEKNKKRLYPCLHDPFRYVF